MILTNAQIEQYTCCNDFVTSMIVLQAHGLLDHLYDLDLTRINNIHQNTQVSPNPICLIWSAHHVCARGVILFLQLMLLHGRLAGGAIGLTTLGLFVVDKTISLTVGLRYIFTVRWMILNTTVLLWLWLD